MRAFSQRGSRLAVQDDNGPLETAGVIPLDENIEPEVLERESVEPPTALTDEQIERAKGLASVEHTKAQTDEIKTSTLIQREDHAEDVKDRRFRRSAYLARAGIVVTLGVLYLADLTLHWKIAPNSFLIFASLLNFIKVDPPGFNKKG